MISGLSISATGVTQLRKRVAGTVRVRGEEGYQPLAAAWNLTAQQEPAVVVAPSDANDIAQAIRIAGAAGLRVAVQTTGHGAAGLMGSDTLLLNMRPLDDLHIEASARIAGGRDPAYPVRRWSCPGRMSYVADTANTLTLRGGGACGARARRRARAR